MAPSEITTVSDMSYPYSKRRPTGKPYNPFQTHFTEHVIDGKETVKLLEAPPITRKPQWKLRSFMHAEEKLTPKLKKYDAATLISIFGNHFEINTHVASEEAEEYVRRFETALLSVDNLSPMGYFNDATDLTCKIRNELRPPNLAYVMVETSVPLKTPQKMFAADKSFNQQF